LGRFESEAWTAIPLLKSKLTHSDRGVRRQVYEALFRIMSPYEYESLVPFLREELTNSDADLRLTARFYLSRIAPQEVAKFDAKQ
jgi:HEAT repeat protein